MFTTQIYGTILGGFVNYAIMITIVNGNRDLLVDGNGDASWSGATIQSYNTNATSWALAKYLYKAGAEYEMVSVGLAIGAAVVVLHRIFVYVSFVAPTNPLFAPNHSPPLSTVRSQNPQLFDYRHQYAPVHSICGIHPVQCVPDLRPLESGSRWVFRPVLPPQLSTSHL